MRSYGYERVPKAEEDVADERVEAEGSVGLRNLTAWL
jgi:hypothetical protein